MIYTQSKINMFFRCAEQFRRRWIENDIMPPGISARVGSGVHHGAYVNHSQKIKTGMDEPMGVILDATRDKYIQLITEEGIYEPPGKNGIRTRVNEGLEKSLKMAEIYCEEMAPRTFPIIAEERIEVEIGDNIFSGIIDVADNKWMGDIKTTGKAFTQSQADSSIQATIYRELYKKHFGRPPYRISFEIFRALKTKADYQQVFTYRDEGDFSTVLARVEIVEMAMVTGNFPPALPEFWGCHPEYCGYYFSCRYIPERLKNTK